MKKIALPQSIEFTNDKKTNKGSVIIEPCYPGYGITLGNSIRRVLLSSLPGAAVVGVKIKGADHEFTALPHVKEDVLELILNLKLLKINVHSEEMVKLELDVAGEKAVKAGDISKNSDVEIVNSDLVLANITNMAGNLKMEIFVSQGLGYETIESREKEEKNELGYIEIDSIFSPVLSVGIDVENVRVGKMTNWDKLILNIATDGSITAEEAFKQANKILVDQFASLTAEKSPSAEVSEDKEDKKEEKSEEIIEEEIKPKAGEDDKTTDEEKTEEPKKKRGRPKKEEETN